MRTLLPVSLELGGKSPTIVFDDADIDHAINDARMVREEIFGPVLAVLAFEDEDDLIEQANDTVYGLACGLWT